MPLNKPRDPMGEMRALVESVRLESHDALSEIHDQLAELARAIPKPQQGLKAEDVSAVAAITGMIEGRIKAGETETRQALEPLKAAVDSIAKALAEITATLAQTTATNQKLCAALDGFTQAAGKPKKRTGVVNTPDGPLSMTITEH